MPETRVLFIALLFYPDEVAISNLFTNLCLKLVESGVSTDVWCAQPHYTTSQKQPETQVYKGIKIHYLKSTTFSKDKLFGRLMNYLTFSISVSLKLLFSRSKIQVLSHTTPPFLAILISGICKMKNRRFIYVIMDVFPDGLIKLSKVSAKNIFIRIWQKLHINAMKKCSEIVVIGRDMEYWLRTIYPDVSGKIRYIPLWQDADLIDTIDFKENPWAKRHNLQEHFIVQYSGNMGLWNDMKSIGKAVNIKSENVIFLFIGGGMRKQELIESIESFDLKNVIFLPFQPNEVYSQSVSACHAAIVSLREGLQGMAVPSKIIGILASGVPVLAMVPQNSEIAYIIREENCGYVIKPGDSEGLINAINELRSDEEMRKKFGLNARNAFLKKYTTDIIAERYLTMLKN